MLSLIKSVLKSTMNRKGDSEEIGSAVPSGKMGREAILAMYTSLIESSIETVGVTAKRKYGEGVPLPTLSESLPVARDD